MDTRTELPAIRKRRGISAAKRAALASVSRQTVYAIEAAAQAFGLSFLPLATERYDLAIRRQHVKLPAVEALLDGLNRPALRRKLEIPAGYDTGRTGEVRLT